ncbi:MAG: hypothetical protein JJT94_02245 [Bernardetiaceae bacterium]|nr:hypothetical protein [Bernardetiaceae bacterium]
MNTKQFEDYRDNKLKGSQKAAFEKRLKEDQEFAQNFVDFQMAEDALHFIRKKKAAAFAPLIEAQKKEIAQEKEAEAQEKKRRTINLWLKISIAASLPLIALLLWNTQKQVQPELAQKPNIEYNLNFDEQFFKDLEKTADETRGYTSNASQSEIPLWLEVKKLLQEGHYAKAISKLDTLSQPDKYPDAVPIWRDSAHFEDGRHIKAKYLMSYAFLKLGEPLNALPYFEKIEETKLYQQNEEIQLQHAKARIKADAEIQKAEKVLEKLANNSKNKQIRDVSDLLLNYTKSLKRNDE